MDISDITRDLLTAPVYPGDPKPSTQRLSNMAVGDVCNTTMLTACLHNGTHMDAPRHFFPEGEAVDAIPLDSCIGECTVVECQGVLLADEAEALLTRLK